MQKPAPASMVVCSSRRRAVTSAFICRWRVGSSGKGYRLAPKASQICARPQPVKHKTADKQGRKAQHIINTCSLSSMC